MNPQQIIYNQIPDEYKEDYLKGYSQRKKENDLLLGNSLETRSKAGEDKIREYACGCGNHAGILSSKSKDDLPECLSGFIVSVRVGLTRSSTHRPPALTRPAL